MHVDPIIEESDDTVLVGIRQISSQTSVFGVNELTAHFGTGDFENLWVRVIFPSLVVVEAVVYPGQTITIREAPTMIDESDMQLPSKYITINSYPNPFNNAVSFSVTGGTGDSYNLEIFDILGRLVKSEHIYTGSANSMKYNWKVING